MDTWTILGAIASLIGAAIAIWQACVAKKNAKIVLKVKDDIRNKNKSLVLTKLNDSTKELIDKLIKSRGKEKKPSDIKKLLESYSPDLSEAVGALKDKEKETLSQHREQVQKYIGELSEDCSIENILDKVSAELNYIISDLSSIISEQTFG